MSTSITTSSVPESDIPGFWGEVSRKYFVDLQCDFAAGQRDSAGSRFEALLTHDSFGDLDLLDLRATPHAVARAQRHARDTEYFILSMLIEGGCNLYQGDRVCHVAPGDLVLYDTRRPYRIDLLENFRMCSLRIPVDTMRMYSPSAADAVAKAMDSRAGVGRIIGGLMLNLFEEQANCPSTYKVSMAKPLLELVSVGIESVAELDHTVASRVCAYNFTRVRKYIEDNLTDPDLTLDQVASALKMSLSSVHRAFANQPLSVGEFIIRRRIEACQQTMMSAASASRSISEVAYAWGFSSSSHFSRVFKKYTGMTPREYRILYSRGAVRD